MDNAQGIGIPGRDHKWTVMPTHGKAPFWVNLAKDVIDGRQQVVDRIAVLHRVKIFRLIQALVT